MHVQTIRSSPGEQTAAVPPRRGWSTSRDRRVFLIGRKSGPTLPVPPPLQPIHWRSTNGDQARPKTTQKPVISSPTSQMLETLCSTTRGGSSPSGQPSPHGRAKHAPTSRPEEGMLKDARP